MGLIKIDEDLINEIMKMSIEEAKNCEFFYKKRIWLHCFLNQNVIDLKKENPVIIINRNNILEESFNQFMTNNINLKQVLRIQFIDEAKHDEYGVFREWYTCLFKEFFNVKNKLFIENNNSVYNGTFIINEFCDKNKFDYYIFFGQLLVKAIIDKVHMKEHLNLTLIKYILNNKIELEDMKFFDLSLYKSLKKINEEKIENNENLKELNFTYNLKNQNGTINKIDLIPGGDKVYLNDNNKKILIEKIIYYETYYKYKEQIEKIKKGFYNIIDDIIGKFYTAQEFDFEIVGMKIIDLNDWKLNTIYKGHFNNENETIKIFWEVLNNLNQNELMTFFEFCTGLCNVPVDGFGSLKGIGNKIMKFTIEPLMSEFNLNDNPNQFKLIQAKACFNTILLPEYKNKNDMEKAIKIIIQNDTSFFGIE
jgi:ubiquitin-protein ligase E3 C